MSKKNLSDARTWLSDSRKMVAGNRFNGRDEALQFIDNLYWAGAFGVLVLASDDEIYADTLVAKLPDDADKRQRLFAIYNQESEQWHEDFGGEELEYDVITKEIALELGDPTLEGEWMLRDEPLKDKGQKTLTFWWD